MQSRHLTRRIRHAIETLEHRFCLSAAPLPGRVEAENFNPGGEGVGYHDTEPANLGGAYRPSEGVDVEPTTDAGGGFNVGWTKPGEYLKYDVHLDAAGVFDFAARVANPAAGGGFHVEVDGVNVTGSLAIPNTGDWQTYATVTRAGIPLAAGDHVVTLVMDSVASANGFVGNFNWFQFTPAADQGSIQGVVYRDTNNNATRDGVELGIADRQVYLDLQGLGHYVAGDPITTSDANGNYAFNNLPAANYIVRIQLPPTVAQNQPTAEQGGFWWVPLGANQTVTGKDFGLLFAIPPGLTTTIFPAGQNVIDAENYASGADGVTYHDTDAANVFNSVYRPGDGVDVSDDATATNGHAVGWIKAGEWLTYGISVVNAGYYRVALRTASAGPGGTMHLELDGASLTGAITAPDTGAWSTWETSDSLPVYLPAGRHVLRVSFDASQQASGDLTNLDNLTVTPVRTDGKQYQTAAVSQGLILSRVNADGTPDAGFAPVNLGFVSTPVTVIPMPDNTVAVSSDVITGSIFFTRRVTTLASISDTGQVLRQTKVADATYPFGVLVNSIGQAADGKIIYVGQNHLETITSPYVARYNTDATLDTTFGGVTVTGISAAPVGVVNFADGGVQIPLYAQQQNVVRSLNFDAAGNLIAPFPIDPVSIENKIQAENFDLGGEGIGYHDADQANLGGAYRPSEGVDIQATSDADPGFNTGYNVGWTRAGEWIKYSIYAFNAGLYDLNVRLANLGTGAAFHVEVDGLDVTGPLAVPDTGGFQTYQTITKSGVSLTAGVHTVRLVFDANAPSGFAGNVNWFQFAPAAQPAGLTIAGTVFADANANRSRDPGEAGLANRQVYLDLQGLGHFVPGDPVATTNASGQYAFTGLSATANYIVRMLLDPGETLTTPQPQYGGFFWVPAGSGDNVVGKDFGVT